MSDREPSDASGALGILWIVVGGLLTLFGGGCALAISYGAIEEALQRGFGPGTVLLLVPAAGIGWLIAWGGVVILRHGIHRLKG